MKELSFPPLELFSFEDKVSLLLQTGAYKEATELVLNTPMDENLRKELLGTVLSLEIEEMVNEQLVTLLNLDVSHATK